VAKKVYKKGMTGQLILGDKKEIFTLLPEYYSFTDFDIHLADSTEIMKEQEFLKQLSMELTKNGQVDPTLIVIISTSKSLTEMKEAVMKAISERKLENNQIQQLQQQLQQTQENLDAVQKQLEASTKKITQLNAKKMAIEQQDNVAKQEIEWFKVKSDAENKKEELELVKQRNQLEALQLVDNSKDNDEVRNDKY
jgi:predicted O-linked N-acetylglucosamine transferase (SPINDLY family)